MNLETARYIIRHFPNLLTGAEKMAIKHTTSLHKIENSQYNNPNKIKIYLDQGWLTTDQNILDLLKDGYDSFELNVAYRIISQNPEKIFFNNCPKCDKLARTPYARQCRFCGHSWHNLIVAQFKLRSSSQLFLRGFFLFGQITKGEIQKGQYMDLTMLGLNKKPRIDSLKFARKQESGKVWEEVGLGTRELMKEDKIYLEKLRAFGTPFDIVNER
ncbi:MAG: hypothetical protein HYZ42_03500 [Bacteroidetes bacterium]|nr:hypothetical protein [Bacteroidota bacterium]